MINRLENTQGLTSEDVREIQGRLTGMALFHTQHPRLGPSINQRAYRYIDAQTKHLDEPDGYREGFRTFYTEAKQDG